MFALSFPFFSQSYTQTSYDLCSTTTCGAYTANSTVANPNIRLVCTLSGTSAVFRIEKCSSTFTSNGTLKVIVSGSADGPCEGSTIKTTSISSTENLSGKTFTSYTLNHPTNSLWYYGVFENTNGNKYYAGCIKITPVATPPTVTTGSASPSPLSCFVEGVVNGNGFGTSYWFEYGTTSNLGSETSKTTLSASTSNKNVSNTITGLKSLTKYYYRLVASNMGGTNYGSTKNFTTTDSWVSPTVTTGSATNITTNAVTLNGTINPNGFTTSYMFKYGLTSSMTKNTSAVNVGNGSSAQNVLMDISGLSENSLYYYAIYAASTNGSGEIQYVQGNTNQFTTLKSNQAPTIPSNPNPSNGLTGVSTSPTLSWTTSDPEGGSVGYDLYTGTSSSNLTLNKSGQGTSASLNSLSAGTTFYWRVVVYDAQNNSTQGSVWSFSTAAINQPPTTPSNPNPINGSTGVSISPTLSWSTSDPEGGSVGYDLYTGTSSSNLSLNKSGQGTSVSLTSLSAGTPYYWRVVVYDAQNNSTQGSIWSFTTVPNSGGCDLSGVSPTNAYYNATLNLCTRNILSGSSADGSVDVTGNLKRSHLAKIAFYGLYKSNGRSLPSTLPSDYYPTVYQDLNVQTTTNSYYYQAAKALLYLEYGDGISPFDRNKTNFNPDNFVSRVDVLKVLMETFNIKPDVTNTNKPYPDDIDANSLFTNNPLKYGYIRKAAALGFITLPSGTSNTNFRPFADCLRGEAFVMLDRIITWAETNTANNPNPTASSYFTPLNITLENLAMGLSLQQGNFNHYTKSSFSIDGIVPLSFAHTYNSYSTDLPDDFYCVNDLGSGKTETYKPMGTGWSHSYHSYATQVEDKLIIHWGGGQIDVYKVSGNNWEPMSVGLYDNASFASSILTIKTKSQIRYLFKRQNTTGPAILQLYSVIDRNGNTLTINYTAGQNNLMVISSVSDGQRQLNFSYKSGTNLLSQITDPLNRSIKFDYTFNNLMNEYQLTKFTDAKNQITQYIYGTSSDLNKCKLLEKIQLPKGNYIQNEYEANRRLSNTLTGKDGIPKTQTAVKVNTNYQTNTLTSKVDVTRATGTSSYNYTFNKNNSTTSITGTGNLNLAATYGNSTKTELPTAVQSNSTSISDIQYDTNWNVSKITKKALSSTETQVISMVYNSFNDITSYTDPKGNVTYYDYDANGNLTKVRAPESATTNITIGSSVGSKGLPIQTVNPEGVTTTMGYNVYGNLNSIAIPTLSLTSAMVYDNASRLLNATDFKGLKTTYTYDSNDNVLTETNPMNYTTSYAYDTNDNLQTITNAKGGATTMSYDAATDWLTAVAFGGVSKQYNYNPDGTLKTFIKPDGTVLTNAYDALGRITSDGVNSYTYDTNLRLSTITKGGKTLTYTYDGFNRVIAVDYNDFSGNKVQYGYDANGNITSMTYPGSKVVNYTYDGLNRMKSVTDWNNKTINYSYRKDDLLQSVSYPNGMTTSFTYDAAGRQTAKTTNRSNGTVIAGYSFKLDSIGNITQETKNEPYQDMPLTASTTNYSFNSANRIQTAGATAFTFDSNGNTTKRGNSTYTWDVNDKITTGDGLTFEYDGLGNRRATDTKRFMMRCIGQSNCILPAWFRA